MAEYEIDCPVCGCPMVKPKSVNSKLSGKCRTRRFSCSNETCDYTEMILGGGYYVKVNQDRQREVKKREHRRRDDTIY